MLHYFLGRLHELGLTLWIFTITRLHKMTMIILYHSLLVNSLVCVCVC